MHQRKRQVSLSAALAQRTAASISPQCDAAWRVLLTSAHISLSFSEDNDISASTSSAERLKTRIYGDGMHAQLATPRHRLRAAGRFSRAT